MLILLRKVEKTLGLSRFSPTIFLVKLNQTFYVRLQKLCECMCVVVSLIFNGPQSKAHKYLKWKKKLLLMSVNKLWLA